MPPDPSRRRPHRPLEFTSTASRRRAQRRLSLAALLADRADQLRLAHLGAPLDPEPCGLAPQLGHGHRAGATAGPSRGPALAGRRFGSLTPKRAACLARQLRNGLLAPRAGLGLLDVLARRLTLLLRRHATPFSPSAPPYPRMSYASHRGRPASVSHRPESGWAVLPGR